MAAKFIKSSADLQGCPVHDLPEVGMIGRSNSGKSSLVNVWVGSKVARVSQTPGKTDLLNFYDIDKQYCLVDTPGYGYAARSKELREGWAPLIEDYLDQREQLRGVILLMDCKREWTQDEAELVAWLNERQIPVVLAVNKIDKLNQKERSAKLKELSRVEGLASINWVSTQSKVGIDELRRTVFENLIRS